MSRPIPLRLLGGVLRRKMQGIEKRVSTALVRVAIEAAPMIRKRTPKAFGELQASTQGYSKGRDGFPVTSVDAPHAKAVEIGTGPREPDMEKLTAWVKLRGMQGLTNRGRLRKRFANKLGFTTPHQAPRVAKMFKSLEVRAKSRPARPYRPAGGWGPVPAAKRLGRFGTPGREGQKIHGRHLPADAARQVAERIAVGIRKHGTRPFWMVRRSLPEIAANMGRRVRAAVKR